MISCGACNIMQMVILHLYIQMFDQQGSPVSHDSRQISVQKGSVTSEGSCTAETAGGQNAHHVSHFVNH